jgi:hypothetical protein
MDANQWKLQEELNIYNSPSAFQIWKTPRMVRIEGRDEGKTMFTHEINLPTKALFEWQSDVTRAIIYNFSEYSIQYLIQHDGTGAFAYGPYVRPGYLQMIVLPDYCLTGRFSLYLAPAI